MQQAKNLISRAAATALAPARNRPLSGAELTREQADSVSYFFFRLRDWDSGRFMQLFPDETSQKVAKRTNAPFLKDWPRSYTDAGFSKLKLHKQSEPKAMTFWTIDEVIGFIKSGGVSSEHVPPAGIYREFRPDRALEDHGMKHRRKAAGEAALSDLMEMFE